MNLDRSTPPKREKPVKKRSNLFNDCVINPIIFTVALTIGFTLACMNLNKSDRGPEP